MGDRGHAWNSRTASHRPPPEPPDSFLDRPRINMKAAGDVLERGAAGSHADDINRDLLVDWGHDRIPENGIKGKGRQGSVPLRSCPPCPVSGCRRGT